jgi:hypothetical protein
VNLWGLKGPTFAEVTFKIGCAEGTVLTRKRSPKRAPKKIFRAADQIIRAGRSEIDPVTA